MFRLRQTFQRPKVDNVDKEVRQQLANLNLENQVQPQDRVAITVGSRGITGIAEIIRTIVGFFQELGAEPFLVPAMGSHGGATAEGQQKVIESYGVTESYCGCPIRSSMETVILGRASQGFDIHLDRQAAEADHILVCGRVKPHTNYFGPIQSGLMKMMLIGLGKHAGASVYHRAIHDFDFQQIIHTVAPMVIEHGKVLAGVAVVENAYDETAHIEALAANDIISREPELLKMAINYMAQLPFDDIDVVMIDEIGKEVSGTGLDTNIVGRKSREHGTSKDERPRVKRIIVRDLTPKSHGNAIGIGLVEFTVDRVVQKMDIHATRINAVTALHLTAAMVPIHYPSDAEVLEAGLGSLGMTLPSEANLVRIRNTLELAEVECSANFLEEAHRREDLEVLSEPRPMTFDKDGNLSAI